MADDAFITRRRTRRTKRARARARASENPSAGRERRRRGVCAACGAGGRIGSWQSLCRPPPPLSFFFPGCLGPRSKSRLRRISRRSGSPVFSPPRSDHLERLPRQRCVINRRIAVRSGSSSQASGSCSPAAAAAAAVAVLSLLDCFKWRHVCPVIRSKKRRAGGPLKLRPRSLQASASHRLRQDHLSAQRAPAASPTGPGAGSHRR